MTAFAVPNDNIGPAPTGQPQLAPPPTGQETLGSAFSLFNPTMALWQHGREQNARGAFAPVDGYNAWDDIKDKPEYLPDALLFAGSRSPSESRTIMDSIDQRKENERIHAASGPMGVIAGFAAGTADITSLLPGKIAISALREGRPFIRSAVETSAGAVGQTTAQDIMLRAAQPEKPIAETIVSVASATILGAMLGPAMRFLSPSEREALTRGLDHERALNDAHVSGRPVEEQVTVPPAAPPAGEAIAPDPNDFWRWSPTEKGKKETFRLANDQENDLDTLHPGDVFRGEDGSFYTIGTIPKHGLSIVQSGMKEKPFFVTAGGLHEPATAAEISSRLKDANARRMVQVETTEAPPVVAPTTPAAKVRAAYDSVAAKEGTVQVPISKVIEESGLTKDEVHRELLAAPDEFNLHPATSANQNLEAALPLPGAEEPMVDMSARAPVVAPAPAAAGAAAADVRTISQLSIAPALGLEKWAFGNKAMKGLMSASLIARRVMADLSEAAGVRLAGNIARKIDVRTAEEIARGEPPRYEIQPGQISTSGPPPLQTMVRLAVQQTINRTRMELESQWMDLVFGGAEKAPRFALTRSGLAELTEGRLGGLPADKPTFEQFKTMVSEAVQNDNRHEIPQAQAAAEKISKDVFDTWGERAEGAVEDFKRADQVPGEGYFPHLWNKVKIAAMRPELTSKLAGWFTGEDAIKREAQSRIRAYRSSLDTNEEWIAKLTARLERRQASLEEAETQAEVAQRFNKFAYQRSEKLSEPLDQMRANIRNIEERIQPRLDKLEQLGEDIKAEKVSFPEIKEADALIFKMIGAAQKLKQSKEPIEAIDAASEYADRIDELVSGFKGGIREASEQAKIARRDLGADALVDLEKARAGLKKEIAPQLKQLTKIRKELAEEQAARLPGARGGAVFETEIRRYGNVIADKLSGMRAEIAEIDEKLQVAHFKSVEVRGKIEDELGKWQGKSAAEAQSALKARAKYEAERDAAREAKEGGYGAREARGERKLGRVASADEAVDRAVDRILGKSYDLTPEEQWSKADQTVQRILGSPDGRLPYDEAVTKSYDVDTRSAPANRGSLAERLLNVPNSFARDFIENDIERVVANHLRTFVPDVLLAERFGDSEMSVKFREIEEEYGRLIAATPPGTKEPVALNKDMNDTLANLAATRDTLRGTIGIPDTQFKKNLGRVSANVRNAMVWMNMGMGMVSSLGDAAGAIARYGTMHTFGDAWWPYFRSLATDQKYAKEAARQFNIMGISIDTINAQRHHALSGVAEDFVPQSPFERVNQWFADKTQIISGLAKWTDLQKMFVSNIAAAGIYRAGKAVGRGTATAKQLSQLAESNITPDMAMRIAHFYETSGNRVDGILLPNTEEWKDTATFRGAAEARLQFEAALSREAEIAVATPGIDRPVWTSEPVLAAITQFKGYTGAAHSRILIANLQRADAQTLQGFVAMIGLGMLSYKAKSVASGQPTSDRPQDWIKEAMSQSNMLGWFEEANTLSSKMTRGRADIYRAIGADKPLARNITQSALGHVLGPTYSKIENLGKIAGDAAAGDWNASDTHALRQFGFWQNAPPFRNLLNEVEVGVNNAFGIPQQAPRRAQQ